jgi:isocitrate dehydrogenase
MATIFAWSGALRKRGELDGIPALVSFSDKLERACIDTIEAGEMTGDLALLWEGDAPAKKLNSLAFLQAVRGRLEKSL